MESIKVLIAGGTGAIGSALIRQYQQWSKATGQSVELYATTRQQPVHSASAVTWLSVDLRQADSIAQAGEQLAGVGVQVLPGDQTSSRTARWIEGALASPLGQSGGQFSVFSGREPTKVPAFVMHRRSSVDAVGGWDASFITSQDSDLSMRLLKSGYLLYRDASVSVRMQKRDTLGNWWKMGHRYGFWRTKVLLKHPGRATWQEFLPLVGLFLTLMLAVVGGTWWAGPLLCYAAVLGLAGIHRTIVGDGWSAMLGVPLCLLMLHTSFTLGLVDGLLRRGRLPSDRG